VNYIREAQLAAGVPRDHLYDFIMYILCGMLVIGLICNLLVKPVNPKWYMSQDEVNKLQAATAGAAVSAGSFGASARADSTARRRCSGPSSAFRWPGACGSRSNPWRLCSSNSNTSRAASFTVGRERLYLMSEPFRTMTRQLAYGTVRDHPRKVIHVVRVLDEILDYPEIDRVAEQMRTHVASRHGEQTPNIVIVVGDSKETLRLLASLTRSHVFAPPCFMPRCAGRRCNSTD
jgi:hypothetical protein